MALTDDPTTDMRLADADDITNILSLAHEVLGRGSLTYKNVANIVYYGNCIVAYRTSAFGDEIIGFLMVARQMQERGTVVLTHLVVREKYRRQHVGKTLLESLIVSTYDMDYQKILSYVIDEEDTVPFRQLLEESNFTFEERMEDFWRAFTQCENCGVGHDCSCAALKYALTFR